MLKATLENSEEYAMTRTSCCEGVFFPLEYSPRVPTSNFQSGLCGIRKEKEVTFVCVCVWECASVVCKKERKQRRFVVSLPGAVLGSTGSDILVFTVVATKLGW